MNEILSKMTHSSWNHKSIMEFSCSAPYVQESKLLIDFTPTGGAPYYLSFRQQTAFRTLNSENLFIKKLIYRRVKNYFLSGEKCKICCSCKKSADYKFSKCMINQLLVAPSIIACHSIK